MIRVANLLLLPQSSKPARHTTVAQHSTIREHSMYCLNTWVWLQDRYFKNMFHFESAIVRLTAEPNKVRGLMCG